MNLLIRKKEDIITYSYIPLEITQPYALSNLPMVTERVERGLTQNPGIFQFFLRNIRLVVVQTGLRVGRSGV